ncbi:MAG: nitronate monooxygenase, partial [Myxococcales bacterium]
MSLPTVLQNRLSLPVVASPMFIASGPELVIAQCKAGVVGSFPALNARPASLLNDWLDRIESELAGTDAAPFAVNQIVHRSNNRLEEDMATIVEHQV